MSRERRAAARGSSEHVAAAVRTVLQNRAEPAVWSGNPGLGFLEPSFRQGAGCWTSTDRSRARSRSPSKLALGESAAGPQTGTLTVKNGGSSARMYDLSFEDAISRSAHLPRAGSSAPVARAGVLHAVRCADLGGDGSGRRDRELRRDDQPRSDVRPEDAVRRLRLPTPTVDGNRLWVTFAGFFGDYQSIQAITSGGGRAAEARSPRRLRRTLGVDAEVPAGDGYATHDGIDARSGRRRSLIVDTPFVAIHFDHQVRAIKPRCSRRARTTESVSPSSSSSSAGRMSQRRTWPIRQASGRSAGTASNGRGESWSTWSTAGTTAYLASERLEGAWQHWR